MWIMTWWLRRLSLSGSLGYIMGLNVYRLQQGGYGSQQVGRCRVCVLCCDLRFWFVVVGYVTMVVGWCHCHGGVFGL